MTDNKLIKDDICQDCGYPWEVHNWYCSGTIEILKTELCGEGEYRSEKLSVPKVIDIPDSMPA